MSINKLNTAVDVVKKTTVYKAANKAVTSAFPTLTLPQGLYDFTPVSKATSAYFTINGSTYTTPVGTTNTDFYSAGISSIGFTWSSAPWGTSTMAGSTSTVGAIAAGNGVFMGALTSGTSILSYTSVDGLTWTGGGTISTGTFTANEFKYLNGYWYVTNNSAGGGGGGFAGLRASSNNGTTWVTQDSTNSVNSIAYGAGTFVTVGGTNWVGYSTTNPSGTGTAASAYLTTGLSVDYGNGLFLAVGTDNAGNNYTARMSTNGITWTKPGVMAMGVRTQLTGVTYSGGKYLAIGYSNTGTTPTSATSTDGISWSPNATLPFATVNAVSPIVYANSKFIVGGGTGVANTVGTIATSTDTVTWTYPTATIGARTLISAVYGNSTYVIATNGSGTSQLVQSSALVSYSPITYANTSAVTAMGYGNGVFLAGGRNHVAYSTTGTSWSAATITMNNTLATIQSLNYLNTTYFAAGSYGQLSTSTNGITWSAPSYNPSGTTSGASDQYSDTIYGTTGGSKYLAIRGTTPVLAVSTDANYWYPQYIPADPYVVSTATVSSTGTSFTVTIPASVQNDVVVIMLAANGASPATPSGWTSAASAGATTSHYYNLIWKAMGATPDTSVTITGATGGGNAVTFVIRNADITTPMDVTPVNTSTTTASTAVAFGAATPVTGAVLVLAAAGLRVANVTVTPTPFYTGATASLAGVTSTAFMEYWSANVRNLAATTPGNATASSAATSRTLTILIRPASTAVSLGSGVNGYQKMAYGNNKYVMGGTAGSNGTAVLRDSTDGLTWTARTVAAYGTSGSVSKLIFANGNFYAVGTSPTSGVITYSTDGITWSTATYQSGNAAAPTAGFTDIFYTGSSFVAISSQGTPDVANQQVWYSTDGASWYLPNGFTTVSAITSISLANGIVFAGNRSDMSISSDGSAWRSINMGFGTSNINKVAYGGTTYVAVGTARTATSTDGITWSGSATSTYNCIAYSSVTGLFVAGGASTLAYSSTPGSWTTVSTTKTWYDVIYANSQYVMVGSGGSIQTSSNGTSWTTRTSNVQSTVDLRAVTWDGSKYIAVGGLTSSAAYSAVTAVSTDGITWTAYNYNTFPTAPTRVNYLQGKFWVGTAAGGGGAYTSTDGIAWTLVDVGFGANGVNDVTYANAMYIAVGDAGLASVSTDGVTWTLTNTGISTALNHVAALAGTDYIAASGTAATAATFQLKEGYINTSYATLTSYGQTIIQP